MNGTWVSLKSHTTPETTMKTSIFALPLIALALALPIHAAEEATKPAGQVDFGTFAPPSDGTFVEINVTSSLINMVARLTENAEPEAAKVLRGLHSVRVNVIGLNDDNRVEVKERMEAVRKQLDATGWERLVTVKDKKEDVGIFTKLRGEEAIEGLAVTVISGNKEAVFINVVGDIRPEQIADVAERLNIEPLKEISKELGARER